jgi:hypothetical protein
MVKPEPQLLRIPRTLHTVEEVLAVATQLNLDNIVVLSERADGSLVFLASEMPIANANWILDKTKKALIQI